MGHSDQGRTPPN